MRIQIEPITLPDPAVYLSCDKAEIVPGNVLCVISKRNTDGKILSEEQRLLSPEAYAAWCDTGPESDDYTFFVRAHAAQMGLVEVIPPPLPPEEPPVEPPA